MVKTLPGITDVEFLSLADMYWKDEETLALPTHFHKGMVCFYKQDDGYIDIFGIRSGSLNAERVLTFKDEEGIVNRKSIRIVGGKVEWDYL